MKTVRYIQDSRSGLPHIGEVGHVIGTSEPSGYPIVRWTNGDEFIYNPLFLEETAVEGD